MTKIIYWISTGLLAIVMLGSGLTNIGMTDLSVQGLHTELGYPLYIIPFLGLAKVLGTIAILVPRFPRLREWAYAGLFFDLLGALYSVVATGGGPAKWAINVIALVIFAVSYATYQKVNAVKVVVV